MVNGCEYSEYENVRFLLLENFLTIPIQWLFFVYAAEVCA